METLKKVLEFLRITENGELSLTNMAVMITLYKIAVTPTVNLTDTTALVVALVGHGFLEYNKS